MLALNELPVSDALSSAGHESVNDAKTGDRNTELRRGQPQQCLISVGGHLANVVHPSQEASGIAAVRRLVRVAHEERNRFRPDVQFLGDRLRIIPAHPGSGLRPARAHQNRIVIPDLEPGWELARVERSLVFCGTRGGNLSWQVERDKKSAANFDEPAPCQRHGDLEIAGRFCVHSHGTHPSGPHDLRGALHRIDDGGVGAAAAQMRRRRRVGESVLDLRHGWFRVLGKQLHCGNHHPALAVTALWHLFVNPRLLDRM